MLTGVRFVKNYLLMSLILVLLISNASTSFAQSSQILVVGTTSVVTDIVRNILPQNFKVESLMGLGQDPHEFQPTLRSAELLNQASNVVYLGNGIEETLSNALAAKSSQGKAIEMLQGVSNSSRIFEGGGLNPHFWMDPVIISKVVEYIAGKFIELYPQFNLSISTLKKNYINDLNATNAFLLSEFSSIAQSERYIVTPHDSLVYFGHRYNFTTISLEGFSTQAQVGLNEFTGLAKFIKEHKIKSIFSETTLPYNRVKAIQEAVINLNWSVSIGGSLYVGSLGDSQAKSYISMLKYDGNLITTGLTKPVTINQNLDLYPVGYFLVSILTLVLFRRKYYAR